MNGICETKDKTPQDVQAIPEKRGEPRLPCILGGKNDKIDSTVKPDDKKLVTAAGTKPFPWSDGSGRKACRNPNKLELVYTPM